MKINENLICQALEIIHSNHLTQSEINSLLGTDPSTHVPDSSNLKTVTLELADLLLASNLTIQQAADIFEEMANWDKNNS